MMKYALVPQALCVWLLLVAGSLAAEPVDYLTEIKPLLADRCAHCHGPDEQNSDLRVDAVPLLLRGGNGGPAIVAGKSGESLLIRAIEHAENVVPMPPDEPKLAADEIALLKRWIDEGAQAPKEEIVPKAQRHRKHWSFQPLSKVEPPEVRDRAWVRNPIDAFILARLESASLTPAPEADPTTLIRRLSLDLIGLPPTPAEVEAFVNDQSPDAYEQLVERLLASPHYGERWGRHWLDAARYADSDGYAVDGARSIWKYRDWVITAHNADMPFDQFTIEQLAGDMLPEPTLDQQVATGFHRNTLRNDEGGTDAEQFRVEAVVDRVSTTGGVFLGLTLGCARCHDHKYDPISQREFYQLYALFNNADEPRLTLPTDKQAKERPGLLAEIEAVEIQLREFDQTSGDRQAEWERRLLQQAEKLAASGEGDALLAATKPLRNTLRVPLQDRSNKQRLMAEEEFARQDPERLMLVATLDELREHLKQLDKATTTTLVMKERKKPRETFVHVRGDFLSSGARVEGNTPEILPPMHVAGQQATRLDLARWLVTADNPLTPRVTVNRIWQQYFGQGIVATENDFGLQGDRPTHPELLDYLARQFITHGWSMKQLHRLIVTSATYRQSSHLREEPNAADPYNKLLARQARLRLDAEIIRDAALAASGLLSPEIGGPSVFPLQNEGIYLFTQRKKHWQVSPGDDRYRRAMYTYFWRSSPYPFLLAFDAPDANNTCTRRNRSNTPLQSLTLANDRVFVELAQGLAKRLLGEPSIRSDQDRLELGFRLCLARRPEPHELNRLAELLASQRTAYAADESAARLIAWGERGAKTSVASSGSSAASLAEVAPPVEIAAWVAVARVLLNLDEFVTRE